MLITLAYRIPRESLNAVLGTVTGYPLTADFDRAWQDLTETVGRPKYKSLTTALCAFSNQPVAMFAEHEISDRERAAGAKYLLVTDQPFGAQFPVAVRTWERCLRDGKGTERLAEQLPSPDRKRHLSEYITYRNQAVPEAPNWVFRTAAWLVAQRLASTPLRVGNKKELALRVDTDGQVLAWGREDLITDGTGTAFGMAVISTRLTTRVGLADPVLCFDASLSRLSPQGAGSKHIWISRKPDLPVLRLPLRHRKDEKGEWTNYLDETIQAIMTAGELSPLNIPADLPPVPGDFRPQTAKNRYHALGSGLGARFMARLHEHIVQRLPEVEPLTFTHDKTINLAKRARQYWPGGIPADNIATSGYAGMTLACLYSTADARARMLAELARLTGTELEPGADGTRYQVNERLDVVTRYCPDLLAHGTRNRAAAWESMELAPKPDRLVAAWLETEFHSAAPPDLDAKPHLRRLLGHLNVPTQFLATDPVTLPAKVRPYTAESKRHMTRAALRDLVHRCCGVIDPRLFEATNGARLGVPLDRKAVLVGLHLRRQLNKRSSPVQVLTMVALTVDPDDPYAWRMSAYSEKQQRWTSISRGIADFHSDVIGETEYGELAECRERIRQKVEARLTALMEPTRKDVSLVIFAGAQSTRVTWPGLQNGRLALEALPGDTLRAQGRDVAVVRVNTAMSEIGRPVARTDGIRPPADPDKPAAPGQKVYRLSAADGLAWYFPGRSVQSSGRFGETPSKVTRWDLDAGSPDLHTPWHAFTAMEIVVVRHGGWEPTALAALTARLSDQPISWDGRTTTPVPLHAAIAADRNHPDYRTEADRPEADDIEGPEE